MSRLVLRRILGFVNAKAGECESVVLTKLEPVFALKTSRCFFPLERWLCKTPQAQDSFLLKIKTNFPPWLSASGSSIFGVAVCVIPLPSSAYTLTYAHGWPPAAAHRHTRARNIFVSRVAHCHPPPFPIAAMPAPAPASPSPLIIILTRGMARGSGRAHWMWPWRISPAYHSFLEQSRDWTAFRRFPLNVFASCCLLLPAPSLYAHCLGCKEIPADSAA
ncbi:hypothetical protein C8R47DRAFT_1163105 [Mycena vitilis]|nr:hypothetical protein C8R47DRAFT_1163105 [Mycena vitilis]